MFLFSPMVTVYSPKQKYKNLGKQLGRVQLQLCVTHADEIRRSQSNGPLIFKSAYLPYTNTTIMYVEHPKKVLSKVENSVLFHQHAQFDSKKQSDIYIILCWSLIVI